MHLAFLMRNENMNVFEVVWLTFFTIFGILSLGANFTITFLICWFKKLRKSPTNVILAHANFLQGVACLASFVATTVDLSDRSFWYGRILCQSQELIAVPLLGTTLFQFQLIHEWYLRKYSTKDTYNKFLRVYKALMFFIYSVSLSLLLVSSPLCYKDSMLTSPSSMITNFCIGLLSPFVIIFNVVNLVKHRNIDDAKRNNVALVVVNIYTTCWSAVLISELFSTYVSHYNLKVFFSLYLLRFLSPVFVLLYLFLCKEYRMFLKSLFTCRSEPTENVSEECRVVYAETKLGQELVRDKLII